MTVYSMTLLRRILKVETNWQFVVVFIVFSITGMGAVFIARPMMGWVGIEYEAMSWYIFWPLRIVFMTICYQIMLVIFGTLAGQREYFWRIEKRMLRRFGIRLK
jgi:hypothetical protein